VAVERGAAAPGPAGGRDRGRVAEARALLAVPGVRRRNLSGLGSGRGERAAAEVKAAVAAEIRAAAA
jgi:hypothetical protein